VAVIARTKTRRRFINALVAGATDLDCHRWDDPVLDTQTPAAPAGTASRDGSSMSAARIERTSHPAPLSDVFAYQMNFEPVSGIEPLTCR
jgi:hypothetical protein